MTGGLMQLVAYGAQDVYLTGNPQVTWFKLIYRRYTNYSMESISQGFTGNTDFGRRVTATISRNGDLLHKVFLQVTLPAVACVAQTHSAVRWCDRVGHALISSYELEIGGAKIDKHYGEWLEIWTQLTLPASKLGGYNRMIGHVTTLHARADLNPYTLYVPLQFWFCKNIGLSLPLVALQFHDVKINVEFSSMSSLLIQEDTADVFTGSLSDCSLYCDYIFLDSDERKRFAQSSHEYLIDTLEFNGNESVVNAITNVQLTFNHPVKFLTFVVQKDEYVTSNYGTLDKTHNQGFNYTTQLQSRATVNTTFDEPIDILDSGAVGSGVGPVQKMKLVLNGHDRFTVRPGDYFNLVQPYSYWPTSPSSPGIYCYSFCLSAAEAQPSGSCNFSRIDTAVMQLQFNPSLFIDSVSQTVGAHFRCYANNINVLRVMGGMSGLAFSN